MDQVTNLNAYRSLLRNINEKISLAVNNREGWGLR